MKLSKAVKSYFKEQGALGGKAAARSMTKAQLRARAIKAVRAREAKRAAANA